jgi:hypothetical protein
LAVRVVNDDGNDISDPDFVDWHAQLVTFNGIKTVKEERVGMHRCKKSDWDNFYSPFEFKKGKIKRL